jgi:carbamoyl-phosphate synthase large subunit
VTRELIPLAAHQTQFDAAGTKLPVSAVESLNIANNKSKLYQFLEWRGIDHPEYRVVETLDQFRSAVDELGFPGKRVCFKPSESNGSRGFRVIANDIDEHQLLFNEKPGSVFLSFQEAVRILSIRPFPQLLVSEYLPGEEYSVDCLANHGEAILVVPRRRIKMVNGVSVEGEFVEVTEIIAYCTRLIKELKLHGNIGMQLKQSDKGKFLLIEINPRVQGTISSALGAGINLPTLAIKQELGLPIETGELVVKWGTKFSRYWNEVFH